MTRASHAQYTRGRFCACTRQRHSHVHTRQALVEREEEETVPPEVLQEKKVSMCTCSSADSRIFVLVQQYIVLLSYTWIEDLRTTREQSVPEEGEWHAMHSCECRAVNLHFCMYKTHILMDACLFHAHRLRGNIKMKRRERKKRRS